MATSELYSTARVDSVNTATVDATGREHIPIINNSTQLNSTNHLGKVANKRKEAQELIYIPDS